MPKMQVIKPTNWPPNASMPDLGTNRLQRCVKETTRQRVLKLTYSEIDLPVKMITGGTLSTNCTV